jgi:SAM-dependent methyltransferase
MLDCRVCKHPAQPIERKLGGPWFACPKCGSHSSAGPVTKYGAEYHEKYVQEFGRGLDHNLDQMRANLDWFVDHQVGCKDRTFLDIGSADGASLVGMSRRGWHPHGFDINPASAGQTEYPTTIAAVFNAAHVPQFSAILCREVIEHVPDWEDLLLQISRATKHGGLVQIQTPLPGLDHPNVYQADHLQLFAPGILEDRLRKLDFTIIESRQWTEVQQGQAFLARK